MVAARLCVGDVQPGDEVRDKIGRLVNAERPCMLAAIRFGRGDRMDVIARLAEMGYVDVGDRLRCFGEQHPAACRFPQLGFCELNFLHAEACVAGPQPMNRVKIPIRMRMTAQRCGCTYLCGPSCAATASPSPRRGSARSNGSRA